MPNQDYQDQLDSWAEAFAETAQKLMPDFTDAAGVLVQAAMIIGLKHMSPMEYAAANLASAEDMFARVSAEAVQKGGRA